ncbi:hypothetical protein N7448_004269 [Penicillium atrosanguineum]|nr:uncharacterized protein N7443_003234 [Penicillium atrosanguineum]KAJ5140861.1 hypothetical protein N7448_004269 [Penicillium atrosanguineum]KAJ5310773.1 hypothetical protein N7443_003234 [Penicillium atrosanguineum]
MAVEFNWAPRSAIDMPTTTGFFSADDPITLGKCKIGIVLSKRPVVNSGYFAVGDNTWSDGLLFDNAFKERQFTITFAQGSFVSGGDIKWKKVKDLWDAPRFRYKMIVDPSPYPARKDWVDPSSVEALGFWNWNLFCAEKDVLFVSKKEKEKEKKKSFGAKLRVFLKKMKF